MKEKREIQIRCVSLSRNHEFMSLIIKDTWFDTSFDTSGKKISNEIALVVNGKPIYKCVYCGLIDDLHEGKYT